MAVLDLSVRRLLSHPPPRTSARARGCERRLYLYTQWGCSSRSGLLAASIDLSKQNYRSKMFRYLASPRQKSRDRPPNEASLRHARITEVSLPRVLNAGCPSSSASVVSQNTCIQFDSRPRYNTHFNQQYKIVKTVRPSINVTVNHRITGRRDKRFVQQMSPF